MVDLPAILFLLSVHLEESKHSKRIKQSAMTLEECYFYLVERLNICAADW